MEQAHDKPCTHRPIAEWHCKRLLPVEDVGSNPTGLTWLDLGYKTCYTLWMRTKVCTGVCSKRLPADEIHFAFKNKSTRELRMECKDCHNAKRKTRYALTPEVRAKFAAQQLKTRLRNRQFVADHLKDNPCVDCGETDGIVLEFDHVRGEKYMNIASMVLHHKTIKAIAEEIAKCDVVCSNCHRRRTAKRAGWDRHYNGSVIEQGTITDF